MSTGAFASLFFWLTFLLVCFLIFFCGLLIFQPLSDQFFIFSFVSALITGMIEQNLSIRCNDKSTWNIRNIELLLHCFGGIEKGDEFKMIGLLIEIRKIKCELKLISS